MPAPLAAQSILLDITDTGQQLAAVGDRGHIVLSADGKTWRQVASPVNAMLNRVRFLDGNRGWAVGYDASILHTADGGASWTLQHFDAALGRPLYDLHMADATHGIAVGSYGQYYVTADGGARWISQRTPLTELGLHLNAIVELSDGSLFIAGERGLLAHSADGGASWRLLRSPYTGSFFGALPWGAKGVLVFGLRGNIYAAAKVAECPTATAAEIENWDARATVSDPSRLAALGWRHLANGISESLFGGAWIGADEALLVGVNGVIRQVNVPAGVVAAVASPAEESLSRAVHYRGRWVGVGRRGVVDLGQLRP